MNTVNILTLKWGDRYGADYVNRLYRGVKAHLHRPFRFVCVTDDPADAINGYRGKHLNTWVKPCPWVKELWEGK